jgi:hypothetical protein
MYIHMTGSISVGCYRLWIFGISEINKYNKVPDDIKVLNKVLSFKGDLRLFLLQHAFYSVVEFMT